MASTIGPSQPGSTGLSGHQVENDKTAVPSDPPAPGAPNALGRLLEPGKTGVFNPDAQFEAKKYSEPEDAAKTADMPTTAEFHDNAMELDPEPIKATGSNGHRPTVDDDDENMEPTEEEKAEREAMLRAGAENAAKQAEQSISMPLAIAVEIDKASKLFRAAFAEGQSENIMAAFNETNQTIRGINKALGNTYIRDGNTCYDRHMMSEGIFSHIAQLRDELATLMKLKNQGKSGSNDPDWVAHNKQVVNIALAARKTLAEICLSWKSITPDQVWAIVEESFSQALPLMDADIQKVAFAMLHLEWQKPTRSQEVTCTRALGAMRGFFEMMDLGDTAEAMERVAEMAKVNKAIVEVNKQCDIVRAPEDHIIPEDFFINVIETYKKTEWKEQSAFLNTARGLLAALLETLGYDDLVSSLPQAPALNTMNEDLRGVKENANQKLLQWRGREYSEKVQSLIREHPAAPSATNETVPRDTTGRGEHKQVTDSIFVEQGEPEHAASATSGPQPSTQHSSAPGLKAQGFRGPIVDDRTTIFGQVVGSRSLARGASRHILNVGTKRTPVYRCFPGATFGRGTGADWVMRFPLPQARDVRDRKAIDMVAVGAMTMVETESKGRNHPITYFSVEWKGEEQMEWLTRSELMSVCGKNYTAAAFKVLHQQWQSQRLFLEDMKQKGLHPDTEKPLTDTDIADMPWLAPESQGSKATSNRSTPKADTNDNSTTHIKLGSGGFGSSRA